MTERIILYSNIVEDIDVAAREWAELLNVPVPEVRVHQTVAMPLSTSSSSVAISCALSTSTHRAAGPSLTPSSRLAST